MWAKKPKKHGVRTRKQWGHSLAPPARIPSSRITGGLAESFSISEAPPSLQSANSAIPGTFPGWSWPSLWWCPLTPLPTTQHRTAWNVHCAPSSTRHWTHPTQNNGFSPSNMLLLESFLSQDLTSLSKRFRPKPRNCPAFPSQSYSISDHFLSSLSLKSDAKPPSCLLDNLLPGCPTHFCRLQPTVRRATRTCLWRYASFPVTPLLHILQKHPIATRIMSGASPGPWHPPGTSSGLPRAGLTSHHSLALVCFWRVFCALHVSAVGQASALSPACCVLSRPLCGCCLLLRQLSDHLSPPQRDFPGVLPAVEASQPTDHGLWPPFICWLSSPLRIQTP